jgi:hypothetical protein
MAGMAIDTTVGGENANSFCTVDWAKEFLTAQPFDTSDLVAVDDEEDAAISDEEIAAGLVYAALQMNDLPWRGQRAFIYQRLCWPRVGIGLMTQMEGTTLDAQYDAQSTTIPDDIKAVQTLVWWFVIRKGFLHQQTISVEDGPDVKSVNLAGLVSATFEDGQTPVGSLLNRIIMSPDFPIYLWLGNYVSRMRFRGARGRVRIRTTPTIFAQNDNLIMTDTDRNDVLMGGTDVNAVIPEG